MNDQELPLVDKELDRLYVTTNWLIETRNSSLVDPMAIRTQFLNKLREQSNLCRQHHQSQMIRGQFNISYGDCSDKELILERSGEDAFDWFGPLTLKPECPPVVIVYIHGGYWQAVELAEASHWADPVTNAGAIFVALSYRLAPHQNIKSMPHQLCIGMQKVYQYSLNQIYGPDIGNSRERIHNKHKANLKICLVGHSAGVQLVLEMLQIASMETSQNNDWFSSIKYLILISGVYDLRPLIYTSINRGLKLQTVDEAWDLSPLRNLLKPTATWVNKPMDWLIAWAQYDSPALIKQSEEVVENLKKTIESIETFVVQGADHFTSIQELFDGPDHSTLMRKILQFVELI